MTTGVFSKDSLSIIIPPLDHHRPWQHTRDHAWARHSRYLITTTNYIAWYQGKQIQARYSGKVSSYSILTSTWKDLLQFPDHRPPKKVCELGPEPSRGVGFRGRVVFRSDTEQGGARRVERIMSLSGWRRVHGCSSQVIHGRVIVFQHLFVLRYARLLWPRKLCDVRVCIFYGGGSGSR